MVGVYMVDLWGEVRVRLVTVEMYFKTLRNERLMIGDLKLKV